MPGLETFAYMTSFTHMTSPISFNETAHRGKVARLNVYRIILGALCSVSKGKGIISFCPAVEPLERGTVSCNMQCH